MPQQDGGYRTVLSNSTSILAWTRVKFSSGYGDRVELAGAGEIGIGVVQPGPMLTQNVANSGPITIKLDGAEGTVKVTAADSFAAGATLYGAASGRVSDSSSGSAIGIALESAGAAGDIKTRFTLLSIFPLWPA